MRQTLCLDFDGVVHSYVSGWQGARVISDSAMPGALAFMARTLQNGWDISIYSARSGHWGGRRAMRNWLKKEARGMWYPSPSGPGLEEIKFPLFKPPASILIDDRALPFVGLWPSEQDLRAFKPWKPA